MRRTLSYPRAALLGGLISGLMALASILIGRLNGWRVAAQNSLILIAIGAGIGVVIRAWIGPGTAAGGHPQDTVSGRR
jgi:hypothetical protein